MGVPLYKDHSTLGSISGSSILKKRPRFKRDRKRQARIVFIHWTTTPTMIRTASRSAMPWMGMQSMAATVQVASQASTLSWICAAVTRTPPTAITTTPVLLTDG